MSSKGMPLFGIYHDAEMDRVAAEVMQSRQIASGRYVASFEQSFGQLIGNPHVVTVNDMSSAIQIALRLAGVGAGDEVLTTAYACMSTNAPIATAGARAGWVDVDPHTGAMDPAALERAITPRSKAVILYHPAGYPADVVRIRAICDAHGLKLIEDCDNALLATLCNRQLGSWGDYAIYSFYPNRQINATEGGAIACRNAEDVPRAKRLRRHGIDLPRFRDELGEINPDSDIPEIGFAATLNNLCAAIGGTQVATVHERVAHARRHAARMAEGLRGLASVRLAPPLPGAAPSYWVLLLLAAERDALMRSLKQQGIQCSKLHHSTDLYTAFGQPAELPGTRRFTEQVLAVPCGWWMSDQDVEQLVNALKSEAN